MIKRLLAMTALCTLLFVAPAAAQTTDPSGLPTPGSGVTITCTISGTTITCTVTGLKGSSTFTVSIFSSPHTLGTATADASGNGSLTATLPAGLEAGSHTVTVSGTDASGQPFSTSTTVPVDAATAAVLSQNLARTGASHTGEYVEAGLAAVALGGLLLVAARKRRERALAG